MLTLAANWLRHMQYNASPRVRMLVRIWVATGTSYQFLDDDCDLFNYSKALVDVTPSSREVDPITRESSVSSCDVTLALI